jgi:hypothetical protein
MDGEPMDGEPMEEEITEEMKGAPAPVGDEEPDEYDPFADADEASKEPVKFAFGGKKRKVKEVRKPRSQSSPHPHTTPSLPGDPTSAPSHNVPP